MELVVKNFTNNQYHIHWIVVAIIYVLAVVISISRCDSKEISGFVDGEGNRWHFQLYRNMDSFGGNIASIPAGTNASASDRNIGKLKALCENDPACYGFNVTSISTPIHRRERGSKGRLKKSITHQNEWVPSPYIDLYVKIPGTKHDSPYPQAIYEGSSGLVPVV